MCPMPKTLHIACAPIWKFKSAWSNQQHTQLCKDGCHSSDCVVSQMSHFLLVGRGLSGAHSLHYGVVVSTGSTQSVYCFSLL